MPEVTRQSLLQWLAKPEWSALIEFLHEAESDALQSLVAADPTDTATVARAQSEIKLLRLFTSGDIAQAMLSQLKT